MRTPTLLLALMLPALAAAEERAAVLPLEAGAPQQAAMARLRQALNGALAERGMTVLPAPEVDRLLVAADAACATAACRADLARLLKAQRLLGGRLSVQGGDGGSIWTVDLWLYSGDRGATVAVLRDRCGACDAEQLARTAPRLVRELLEQGRASAGGAVLAVGSRPSGAPVTVDGTPVGITPLSYGVSPGRHTVTVQAAGYRLSTQEITAEAGSTARVEALLDPDPSVAPTSRGLFSPHVLRWVALGVAIAGLGAGIPLLAIHGRGTCDDAFGECPERQNTLAPGIALTAVGALSAGAAVLLFYLDGRRPPARETPAAGLRPRLDVGAASIRASWRF